MFSTLYDTYFLLSMHFKMSSAISFNLDRSKKFSSGNELMTVRKKTVNLSQASPGFYMSMVQIF